MVANASFWTFVADNRNNSQLSMHDKSNSLTGDCVKSLSVKYCSPTVKVQQHGLHWPWFWLSRYLNEILRRCKVVRVNEVWLYYKINVSIGNKFLRLLAFQVLQNILHTAIYTNFFIVKTKTQILHLRPALVEEMWNLNFLESQGLLLLLIILHRELICVGSSLLRTRKKPDNLLLASDAS